MTSHVEKEKKLRHPGREPTECETCKWDQPISSSFQPIWDLSEDTWGNPTVTNQADSDQLTTKLSPMTCELNKWCCFKKKKNSKSNIYKFWETTISQTLMRSKLPSVFLLDSSKTDTLATWCEELTHLKRPWCWERLKAGGEGDDRGWDGWMASPTQWTWVWVNSGSWR